MCSIVIISFRLRKHFHCLCLNTFGVFCFMIRKLHIQLYTHSCNNTQVNQIAKSEPKVCFSQVNYEDLIFLLHAHSAQIVNSFQEQLYDLVVDIDGVHM